jgi:signal transduction histidine kinase
MLHELITTHRALIIERTRTQLGKRSSLRPTDFELDQGIPLFLDQLSETLRISTASVRSMDANAAKHGAELLRMGFSVSQVVHGYGDVCQVVTELALELDAPIATDEFRVFNRCLDDAIASAVVEYERQRDAEISRQGTERLGVLAHELRNALSTAMLAFGTLKRGVVGPDSSTGTLLNRSLLRLRDLVDRSLSEVRLEAGVVDLQDVLVSDLIEEVAIAAAVEAGLRGVSFTVKACDAPLRVEADGQLLIGAVQNLVQNALKFTPRGGHVTLIVDDVEGQVLIEVRDECGGILSDKLDELFKAFSQHGADRTGLGLGLWISRASVTAIGGTLALRNLPNQGCAFSIKLPKS